MRSAFHQVVGESGITVFRDNVWWKPWHLYVRSGNGTGHMMFWREKNAQRMALWVSTLIADALEAKESR